MKSKPEDKYQPLPRLKLTDRQWPEGMIDKAPIWCSVDLRDGNQALPNPMGISQKMEMFELLVAIGFKEIEVGFPSASQVEFGFMRRLIESRFYQEQISKDITLQVLTQAREHLIRRSFESLRGARRAIIHLYNSTSPLQRRVTFGMSKAEVKRLAIDGTRLVKSLTAKLPGTRVSFEYSPESFSDTEMAYALEICESVMEVWEPTAQEPIILNLPATVEWTTPNVYADQIEWFCRHLRERDKVLISLHTHNDRGTGTAATELGLLAGADRVEGTLFGNGERTGNLDIVTVALNLYTQGIPPGLDFSDLPRLRAVYERCTGLRVPERQPYSGDLVFTAFSGSHQDAIKKGMDLRSKEGGKGLWCVPYLTIDPNDIGRTYDAIIRINSQSGKGGVAYVMAQEFGLDLPKALQPELGAAVNQVADPLGRELDSAEIYRVFQERYLDIKRPLELVNICFTTSVGSEQENVTCAAEVQMHGGQVLKIEGSGNGPINAFVHALEGKGWKTFKVKDFRQHAIGAGSATEAAAYVQVVWGSGKVNWGVGIDTHIDRAGVKALISAFNRGH